MRRKTRRQPQLPLPPIPDARLASRTPSVASTTDVDNPAAHGAAHNREMLRAMNTQNSCNQASESVKVAHSGLGVSHAIQDREKPVPRHVGVKSTIKRVLQSVLGSSKRIKRRIRYAGSDTKGEGKNKTLEERLTQTLRVERVENRKL